MMCKLCHYKDRYKILEKNKQIWENQNIKLKNKKNKLRPQKKRRKFKKENSKNKEKLL